MRGRKPTPTVLKILRGNPGKRALPLHEPDIPAAAGEDLDPPDFLSVDAQKEWRRIAPRLVRGGLLSEVDRAALMVYAIAFGDVAEAERAIRLQGKLVKSPNGYPIHNPNLAISRSNRELLAKMCPEFGMTPSSRARVAAAKTEGKPSKLARFVKNYGT